MGKCIDLSGQRFGHLLVECRVEDYVSSGGNRFPAYKCVCDCGRHKVVTANKLRTGHTSSCGQCDVYNRLEDLTGRRFDKLVVLRQDGYHTYPNGDREYRWLCQCDCGGTISVLGKSLKVNGPHSCNCYRHVRNIVNDMLGRKFGKLTVMAREKDLYTKQGTVIDQWLCHCDCGNNVVVRGASLRNGHTSSCGCYRLEMLTGINYMSKSETAVANVLDELGVIYVAQKTYCDLVGVANNLLSYDFCVNMNGDDYLIECQGLQHYQSVEFFGGEHGFGCQKVHDYRKAKYAEEHDYKLLALDCRSGPPKDLFEQVFSFLNV